MTITRASANEVSAERNYKSLGFFYFPRVQRILAEELAGVYFLCLSKLCNHAAKAGAVTRSDVRLEFPASIFIRGGGIKMDKLERRAIVNALAISAISRKIEESKRMACLIPAIDKSKDNLKSNFSNWVQPQIEQYFSNSHED